MELRSLTLCWTDLLRGTPNGRVGLALLGTNSRCLSRAAFLLGAAATSCLIRRYSCIPALGGVGLRAASLSSEARTELPQRALPLLRLKPRRSPATRWLPARGRRGFREATEGVALQRRLCP